MIRITHFRSKCIGCNACVEANFERWRISKKDGKCTLISGKQKNGYLSQPYKKADKKTKPHKKKEHTEIYSYIGNDFEYEANKTAAKNCPVKIIKVEKF